MSKEAPDEKVMAAVLESLPGKHLAIWSTVKAKFPEVHPAAVWRALASAELERDDETGVWSKKG